MAASPSATTQATGEAPLREGRAGAGVTVRQQSAAVPLVSVVLVHWERAGVEDTVECLKSLSEATYPCLSTILVNNGAQTFPSERFLAASQEELEGVPGMPAKTARTIYAQLHKAGRA